MISDPNTVINVDPCGSCILIADSLPGLRSYAGKIVKSLTERYVNIVEAEDGQAVVELARAHAPELVIMDVSLTQLNGIKAAAEIWHHKPDTKILFWTQYHREVYVRDLRRIVPVEAVHGYVLKNHTDDKLRYAILSVWLHSNPYTDPDVRQSMLPNPREMLSDHEFETLQDLVLGLTEKAISMRRNISVRGVQCRTAAVYNKLLPNKRGGAGSTASAGAGCFTPPTSTNALRCTLCGCTYASLIGSTGAKQTSVPSMIAHHSSRVFARNFCSKHALMAGHPVRSCRSAGRTPGAMPRRSSRAS